MNNHEKVEITIRKTDNGLRLDKFLKQRFPEWGRDAIKKLVNSRKIYINGKPV